MQVQEDLEAFVQRNVQAAVEAAQDNLLGARGSEALVSHKVLAPNGLVCESICKDASAVRDPDYHDSEPDSSSFHADQLNVPGQPQVAIRLYKARTKVRMLQISELRSTHK